MRLKSWIAVVLLALVLIALATRLRKRPAQLARPPTAAPSTPATRPTVNPAIQRKVA